MTHARKRILYAALGFSAGIAAWPIMELLTEFQALFPSLFLFSLTSGALLGGIFGLIIGSGEGIVTSLRPRIIKGAIAGLLLGITGGTIGFFLGQAVLLLTANSLFISYASIRQWAVPLSRLVGWSVIGIFVTLAEGLRSRSIKKILIGVIGGISGGMLGSIIFTAAEVYLDISFLPRLLGLGVMGLTIGFVYSLVEKIMATGVLRVLNGKLKGKEFVLSSKNVRIGSGKKSDIILSAYKAVAPVHAVVTIKKGKAVISTASEEIPLLVNEEKQTSHRLKWEDVLRIGNAKFLFKTV